MLYCNKTLYDETRSLKKGRTRLSPCLEALRLRISEHLGITVLNIIYDVIENGPVKGRSRLDIIVESAADYQFIYPAIFTINEHAKDVILREFADIIREMGVQSTFNTRDVHLFADDFSDEAMNQAAFQFFHNDAEAIVKRYSSDRVWKITGISHRIVIFFSDEKAKDSASVNGVASQIRQVCYNILKGYDEFNYFTPEKFIATFDSKENLDKKYLGNLLYYFR